MNKKPKVTPLTHSQESSVFLAHYGPGHWQHIDRNSGQTRQVGPIYPTQAEALADTADYARRAGWMVAQA